MQCKYSPIKKGFGIKGKPQVGYSTALDIYIILCFIYTFAALTEFAIVNFIPKFVKRLKDKEEATPSENVLSKEASIKLISEFASEQETSQAEGGENIRTRTRVFSLKDCGLKIPDVKKMLLYEETQYVIDRMDEISR